MVDTKQYQILKEGN